MKKIILMTTVLATVFAVSNAFAADDTATSATGQGTVNAKIVAPIKIEQVTGKGLNFGTIAVDSVSNKVTIDTDGVRTATSEGSLITDSTNAPQAGEFTVTGEKGRSVTIAKSSSVTVTDTDSHNTMTVDNIMTNPASSLVLGSEDGKGTIRVGADVTVGANQPVGEYTGTYDITVTY